MRRPLDWFREQSRLAETRWQRGVWGRPAARLPARTEGFHPDRKPAQSAPNSIAAAIYPHLSRESREKDR
jgi:hypothetical protein